MKLNLRIQKAIKKPSEFKKLKGTVFLQKILEGKLDVKYVKVEGLAADLMKAKEMMVADNHDPTTKVYTISPI